MRIVGTGRGNPVGAPLEAVIADLCSTRTELAALLVEVAQMRAEMSEKLGQMIELLVEVRDACRAGLEESQAFRADMAALRQKGDELVASGAALRDSMDRTRG